MDIAKTEIKTPRQRKTLQRHERICEIFRSLQEANPDASQSRIILTMISKRMTNLRYGAIRNALINYGLYKLKSAKQ